MAVTHIEKPDQTTPAEPPAARKVLVAAGIGNFIEWYDFVVYGFVATVLAPLFFPSDTPFVSLLAAFAVFGVGFGMRPIGGLVLGHLADRYGRKNVLVLIVSLMAVGTLLLGIAPTYAQAGVLGPVILVFARALQGFSVGGEFAGAAAFMIEHAPEGRRGRYGGWQMFGQMGGVLAGAIIAGLLTVSLGPDALSAWGWRVAFLVAVPLIIVAFYIRRRLEDTPSFRRVEASHGVESAPLLASLRQGYRQLLLMVGVVCLPGLGTYVLFISMPSYLDATQKLPLTTGLGVTIAGLVVFTGVVPLFAALSDRVGRRPLMRIGALGIVIVAYPAYLVIGTGSIPAIVGTMLVTGLFLGMIHAPMPVILAEAFPTRIRVSSMAIAYSVATALFAGTAPYVSTWLLSTTGDPRAPGLLVTAAAVVTFVTAMVLRETYRDDFTS